MVDGAGRFRIFRDVTFPMLAPAFTIVTVLSFILIFRAFDLIYVLGGPRGCRTGATLVLGVLIYSDAFGQGPSIARPASATPWRKASRSSSSWPRCPACSSEFLGRRENGGEVMTSRELSGRPRWHTSIRAQSSFGALAFRSQTGLALAWYAVMIAVSLIVLIPIILVILGSFKTGQRVLSHAVRLAGAIRFLQLPQGVGRSESATRHAPE